MSRYLLKALVILSFPLITTPLPGQSIPPDSMYLGRRPPAASASLFAKGVVSTGNLHGRIVFSPDGKEIFWTTIDTSTFASQIKHTTFTNGRWSPASAPSFAVSGITGNPLYSPDGQKLFLNYRNDVNSAWTVRYVEKLNDTTWSPLKSGGFMLSPSCSFANNGKVYYSDYRQNKPWQTAVYCAVYSSAGFSSVQLLDQTINSNCIDYTPFIASDESFLLFSCSRPSQEEDMHIYVSFKKNGGWTAPLQIHDAVGFSGNARFPVISPDGKYLFFCGDDGNMYWAAAAPLLSLNDVKDDRREPAQKRFRLSQNYPNPFNPETRIQYSLISDDFVQIKIFNLLGAEIAALVDGYQRAGEHSVSFNAGNIGSGVYLCKMLCGSAAQIRKMALLR